jgi:hypothetical protein
MYKLSVAHCQNRSDIERMLRDECIMAELVPSILAYHKEAQEIREAAERARKRLLSIASLIGYYDGPDVNSSGHAPTNAAYRLALGEAESLRAALRVKHA